MRTAFMVVGWSLAGCVLAFVSTYAACFIYNSVVPNTDANEYRAWSQFALLMFSPWFGFVPGAVYGIIRARRRRQSSTKS
jgi:hypothetical protein